jgi:hypothetical protein
MFCARCGQQIPAASEICPLCGQEATLKLEPVPPLISPAPSVPYAFVTVPQDLGLHGVGGWLWAYCFISTILVPLGILLRLAAWKFQNPLYSLEQIRLLYGAVVGGFLWMERPIAILLLRIYFLFVAVNCLLTILWLLSLARSRHTSFFEMPGLNSTLFAVGIALLWFAYFHKSERVRNTYGANL